MFIGYLIFKQLPNHTYPNAVATLAHTTYIIKGFLFTFMAINFCKWAHQLCQCRHNRL